MGEDEDLECLVGIVCEIIRWILSRGKLVMVIEIWPDVGGHVDFFIAYDCIHLYPGRDAIFDNHVIGIPALTTVCTFRI